MENLHLLFIIITPKRERKTLFCIVNDYLIV